MFDELNLDDLVCVYQCIDLELSRFDVTQTPKTLIDYYNQLSRCLEVFRHLIKENITDDRP